MVEEEQQEDPGIRELTTKTLREQHGNWERSKTRELGKEAILGPGASPKKRAMEEEEGNGADKFKKKRRRKLKHQVLEEGWGELPTTQGAVNQPTPLLQTLHDMEQEKSGVEQLTTPREQDITAAPA